MTNPYHLKISPAAKRHFFSLDASHQKSALKMMETLAMNPHPQEATRIEGMTGLYRQAGQKLTLIYKVEEQDVLVLLIHTP